VSESKRATTLVTGGAGFIGSHLCDALVARGHRVRVLDDLSNGCLENLAPVLSGGDETGRQLEFFEGDLRDRAAIDRALEGCGTVFHLGALGSVPRSINDPWTSHEVNVNGTLRLLQACRDSGVRRLVFSSSSSVYGNVPGQAAAQPKSEELPPRPMSPYAVTKLAGESYVRVWHDVFGVETVSLRYFNVFGPRQSPQGPYAAVIPLFTDAILAGRNPVVFGDGEQSRDFTYVTNVVQANLLAAEVPEAAGGVFNVAAGEPISVNGVLKLLRELLPGDWTPEYREPRPGDVRYSYAHLARAREVLGFRPTVGLREGIEATVAWHRQRHERAQPHA
jgi:nucleoside-diphosphate-sugar epimerase